MDQWKGKIAVVTGASSGIGATIVIELVKSGLTVIGAARREEKILDLQKELTGAPGVLFAKKTDVTQEEDITQLFQWVKEKFGFIHVLINNAGISRYGKLYDQNPKFWRQILDTNVLGLSICTQQALALMKESGVDDGHIIHINSIMGHSVPVLSTPRTGMYAASKHAVTALTETLRQELRSLKSKIKVTSISPGVVATDIGEAASAAMDESERIDRSKLDCIEGEPRPSLGSKDIADAVMYVLSTPPHVQVHELTIKPIGEIL